MPKAPKKDPNALLFIPQDTWDRGKRIQDGKILPKPPKPGTDLSPEEWCIAPVFQSEKIFKQSVSYWQQCAIVRYNEKDSMDVPAKKLDLEDESKSAKKDLTFQAKRKEITDLFKFLKKTAKQATKRTGQFLKQLMKKEGKETKRENLLKQIQDVDKAMNDELRNSRNFAGRQELFNEKYMKGSKLGTLAPRKNALVVLEVSDACAAFAEEMKDEVKKLFEEVIKKEDCECETINICTFNGTGQTVWMPQFQNKNDVKKGINDSVKWMNKQISKKTCDVQAFPPDYVAMLQKFTGEGMVVPWRIYLCCSRRPEQNAQDALDLIKELRTTLDPPAKDQPVLPINVVAFDPQIVGNDEEKAFFEEVAGPSGSFMIDTSQEDLLSLDKMLKAVQVKKKQLDKLNKKLDKMDDLSEAVAEDRRLLQTQIALEMMIKNDLDLCDWALKNDKPPEGPEI